MNSAQPTPTKTATDLHWNRRAAEERDDTTVNIGDTVQRALENDFILPRLPAAGRVLEIGCGNGYLTRLIRERVAHVDAFDYAENMVARAIERCGETNNRFFQDNLLAPERVRGPYDAAVCVRVLINLPDVAAQRAAIGTIAGWLRPGGRLILVEGFADGFEALNALREKAGIAPMAPAAINVYDCLDAMMPAIEAAFAVEERFHSGMFDFLTRVVYPSLVGADRANGPADFHKRIAPIARAFNPEAMRPLARLHGFLLTKRSG